MFKPQDPRRALSGGPQRVSLVRCLACRRAEECSPAAVLSAVREGGMRCCGEPMELFIQAGWPGPTSHAAPAPAAPAEGAPAAPADTIAW